MVARLVAMGVHADKAGHVGLVAAAHGVVAFKEAVEELDCLVFAANKFHPGKEVVRHVCAVLPRVGLGIVVVDLRGVEGRHPAAVALGVGKAVAVDDVLPALAAYPVGAGRGCVASHLGHLGDAPVIVSILEGLADALVVNLGAEVSLGSVGAVGLGTVAGRHHSIEQLLGGIARQRAILLGQMDIGLEHHRHSVVPYHAVRLVAGQLPHGQLAALLEIFHGGVDKVDRAFRFNLRQQRVQGTVGVPKREDGVDFAAGVDGVNLVVSTAVATISIAPEVGRGHAMVQGGVEAAFLLLRATFHFQLAEGGLPSAVGSLSGFVEGLVFRSIEIIDGALNVHAADGHLQLKTFSIVRQVNNGKRRVFIEEDLGEVGIATDGEVQVLVGVPCRAFAPAHNHTVAEHYLATE